MKPMLRLNRVTKTYKNKTVVDNLSIEINEGEVFALLGANGAGKTTTIKMILGLTKTSSGDIEIAEDKKIGYSPETPYFPPYLTAMEIMKYYAGLEGDRSKKDEGYLRGLLETVGLEDSKTKVRDYSKGMVQRLALAQALISDPDILILDEPTAALDMHYKKLIRADIRRMAERGTLIILVSHDSEELDMCNTCYRIAGGVNEKI